MLAVKESLSLFASPSAVSIGLPESRQVAQIWADCLSIGTPICHMLYSYTDLRLPWLAPKLLYLILGEENMKTELRYLIASLGLILLTLTGCRIGQVRETDAVS